MRTNVGMTVSGTPRSNRSAMTRTREPDNPLRIVAKPTTRPFVAITPPLLRTPDDWKRRSVRSSKPAHDSVVEREVTIISGGLDDEKISKAAQTIIDCKSADLATRHMIKSMQLIDAIMTTSRPLPQIVLDALASAWAIKVKAEDAEETGAGSKTRHGRRVRKRLKGWPDSDAATDEALELAVGPIKHKHRKALHRILRWFTREGLTITWGVRRAVAQALRLVDADTGDWRTEVMIDQSRWKVRNREAFSEALIVAAEAYRNGHYDEEAPWEDYEDRKTALQCSSPRHR